MSIAELERAQEIELVNLCIAGHPKAQRELFNKYKKLFYSLAYKSLGTGFDLDEIVHEIFIQIFRSLPSFKGKSAFPTWIYRIALNVCLSRLRSKMRKRQLSLVQGLESVENRVSSQENPATDLDRKEFETIVQEALHKLDDRKHLIIVLHDMEGKSIEEIALLMKKPTGTIKSRLFHGRKELKKRLQKYLAV
ncbi:MAG: hypothetical protein A2293_16500 [Elusimicrobia bacterium RIFOXYB2_FULL_49_7]|nr:MAG: hypothetical protein A2293_16500 [Elusimicrobia bacterium RIFOXYB2_FULL_49_7]